LVITPQTLRSDLKEMGEKYDYGGGLGEGGQKTELYVGDKCIVEVLPET
jgi:hypothetical protein